MTEEVFVEIFTEGIMVFLGSIVPILIISIIVGLTISIFQAVTSIQEQTLTFAPKIIITFLTVGILFSWIIQRIADYAYVLFTSYMGMI